MYRGIFVEKVIQLIDPFTHEAIGDPISEFTPGTTVKVTIQVGRLREFSLMSRLLLLMTSLMSSWWIFSLEV